MLEGDLRRLKLAYSLMFALPGTPVIWYGEEIGMGEDLSLKEREAVRTPLQWSDDANAGFSSAPGKNLVRPVVAKGSYGYRKVNIASQISERDSLFNFLRELVRVRRATPEIGWGKWKVLEADTRVLGLCTEWQGNSVVTLHNLSDTAVKLTLKVEGSDPSTRFIPVLSGPGDHASISLGATVTLEPYGYLWLRANAHRR
jgi:maltose alpha-D-glucosyltransferase/alpha-amylase